MGCDDDNVDNLTQAFRAPILQRSTGLLYMKCREPHCTLSVKSFRSAMTLLQRLSLDLPVSIATELSVHEMNEKNLNEVKKNPKAVDNVSSDPAVHSCL